MSLRRVVVSCDGAKVPRDCGGDAWTVLKLHSNGPAGSLNIRVPSLSAKVRGAVHPKVTDLVRMAAFAYWADQMERRPADTDVNGQRWRRRFVVAMPVLDMTTWERPEVGEALARVLSYGTDDEWEFRFQSGVAAGQGYLFDADPAAASDPASVLMFSGGTDSLCAAVEESHLGRRPLLISHSPSSRAKSRQDRLWRELAGSELGWPFPRLGVEVSKVGVAEKERTQRTRGFLYSALGAAVAASFRIPDVVIADNGFVSIGLPLSGQTIGAKMSRTTHPRFQHLFNRLMALVLPEVRIRNPLLFRTRAESLEVLQRHSLEPLLRQTHSCGAAGRLPAGADHCGVCSQCLDRRVGIIGAHCQQWEVAYQRDIFLGELEGTSLMLAESYLRLMRKLADEPPDALVGRYVELIDCATADVDGSPDAVQRIAEMAVRQADTFRTVIRDVAEPLMDNLLAGAYPRTCLLGLALAPGASRTRKPWRAPVVPEVVLTEREEAEAVSAAFKASVPVVITGEVASRASNVVEIGGRRVTLADADFTFLLCLIVQLWSSADGYCEKGGGRHPGGLVGEGVVPADVDNAILRLRRALQPGLAEVDPHDFVEVRRPGVRLSIHRRYVLIERDKLRSHPNHVIRSLESRLPMM
jgi:hypothetical protein